MTDDIGGKRPSPGASIERGPKPARVQRRRVKGWRMPENTVYVGRGSVFGNMFPLSGFSREEAVRRYGIVAKSLRTIEPRMYEPLRGKNLACWCRLDQACHADILLELANG